MLFQHYFFNRIYPIWAILNFKKPPYIGGFILFISSFFWNFVYALNADTIGMFMLVDVWILLIYTKVQENITIVINNKLERRIFTTLISLIFLPRILGFTLSSFLFLPHYPIIKPPNLNRRLQVVLRILHIWNL